MTEKEKLELIKEKYPNYKDVFSQSELDSLVRELDDPEKLTLFRERGVTQILGGAALGGLGAGAVKGAQAVKGLAKAVASRKTKTAAAEGAETVVKKSSKTKKAVKFGVAGAAVATGLNVIESLFGNDEEQIAAQEESLQQQTDINTQMQFAQMQASGIDTEALLNTPAGQQLLKNPNFNSKAIFGVGTTPVLGMSGVYVGGETQVRRRKPTPGESGMLSLTEWKNQFPIANPTELNKWKKTLVDAGVVGADAGLPELKKQWENWGQESMNFSRLGQKLTPYQLLDIQRGLWGGGTGGPSYQVQLMKEENSKALFKQGIEALTGRIVDDAQAEEFAKLVTKKQLKTPTKTETKTVGGKRVSVTTPGFGESEAAALVKKRAQEDPMFAEFQTANVFGSALEKALGVRG